MKEGQTQEPKEPSCTLTNEELIKRCNDWVYKLAKTGGKDWTLRVPVDFNHDPDILFIELGKRLAAIGERKFTLDEILLYGSKCVLNGRNMNPVVYFKEHFNVDITTLMTDNLSKK